MFEIRDMVNLLKYHVQWDTSQTKPSWVEVKKALICKGHYSLIQNTQMPLKVAKD